MELKRIKSGFKLTYCRRSSLKLRSKHIAKPTRPKSHSMTVGALSVEAFHLGALGDDEMVLVVDSRHVPGPVEEDGRVAARAVGELPRRRIRDVAAVVPGGFGETLQHLVAARPVEGLDLFRLPVGRLVAGLGEDDEVRLVREDLCERALPVGDLPADDLLRVLGGVAGRRSVANDADGNIVGHRVIPSFRACRARCAPRVRRSRRRRRN